MERNDSSAAMNSLLSAYSAGDDDEPDDSMNNEVDNISDEDDDHTPALENQKKPLAEKRRRSISPEHERTFSKKALSRLVSYAADDVEDDEEDEPKAPEANKSDDEEIRPEILGINFKSSLNTADASALSRQIQNLHDSEKIKIPPEPPGKGSKALQEKIRGFYEKMKRGQDLNHSIQKRKDFRNPSIYEKLIIMLGIDEKGTNYPPEIYNSSIWGPESYYDELAKIQKVEMDKREKERKERTKVEFVVATKKADGTETKRKSKWDTQPATVAGIKSTILQSSGINPGVVSLSTNSSGAKTQISSIGSIKKTK